MLRRCEAGAYTLSHAGNSRIPVAVASGTRLDDHRNLTAQGRNGPLYTVLCCSPIDFFHECITCCLRSWRIACAIVFHSEENRRIGVEHILAHFMEGRFIVRFFIRLHFHTMDKPYFRYL